MTMAISMNDLQVAQDTEDKAKVDVETMAEHLRLLGNDPDQPNGVVEVHGHRGCDHGSGGYQRCGRAGPGFEPVSLSYPCSTRAFISEYAASMSRLSAAAFVAVPGLSFTWRMNLPVPCSK
jgi:hypothetical protein